MMCTQQWLAKTKNEAFVRYFFSVFCGVGLMRGTRGFSLVIDDKKERLPREDIHTFALTNRSRAAANLFVVEKKSVT
jgi:hypothetical protein